MTRKGYERIQLRLVTPCFSSVFFLRVFPPCFSSVFFLRVFPPCFSSVFFLRVPVHEIQQRDCVRQNRTFEYIKRSAGLTCRSTSSQARKRFQAVQASSSWQRSGKKGKFFRCCTRERPATSFLQEGNHEDLNRYLAKFARKKHAKKGNQQNNEIAYRTRPLAEKIPKPREQKYPCSWRKISDSCLSCWSEENAPTMLCLAEKRWKKFRWLSQCWNSRRLRQICVFAGN